MIVWPSERILRDEGRRALRQFEQTSAARELEITSRNWHVVGWPWTDDLPIRIVLHDDAYETIVFTQDEDGIWSLSRAPSDLHRRSNATIEREARALVR